MKSIRRKTINLFVFVYYFLYQQLFIYFWTDLQSNKAVFADSAAKTSCVLLTWGCNKKK